MAGRNLMQNIIVRRAGHCVSSAITTSPLSGGSIALRCWLDYYRRPVGCLNYPRATTAVAAAMEAKSDANQIFAGSICEELLRGRAGWRRAPVD